PNLSGQSKCVFLQLEGGGGKIPASKGGYGPAGTGTAPATASAAAVAPAPPSTPAQSAAQSPSTPPAPSMPAAAVPEGLVAITAPMVGKFYSAPAPSDPPYVEVGSRVEAGAAGGLIGVMKVFASIKT